VSELNIHQRINAVMRDCDYLQKQKAAQGTGVRYDDVIAMIRGHMINHGIVMVVRQTEMEMLNVLEGTKQKIFQGRYEMDLVNIDKPEEKVTHSTYAHGMDGGDKAPGKSQTYAVKIMLVKGFGIETGIDEESRSEKIDKTNLVSQEQANIIQSLTTQTASDGTLEWTPNHKRLMGAYKVQNIADLPASKFDEVMETLEQWK